MEAFVNFVVPRLPYLRNDLDTQLLINKHMESLLGIEQVTSIPDVKGLDRYLSPMFIPCHYHLV